MVMVRPGPLYWPWDAGNGPGESWPFRDPAGRGADSRCGPGLHQSAESYARGRKSSSWGVRGHRPDYGPAADPGRSPCEEGSMKSIHSPAGCPGTSNSVSMITIFPCTSAIRWRISGAGTGWKAWWWPRWTAICGLLPVREKEILCDTLILSVGLIPENEADPGSRGGTGYPHPGSPGG